MTVANGAYDATFATFHGVYDRPTTYHHWQLRDLVHCSDEEPGVVYCVHHAQLIRYDVLRNQSVVVRELRFEPTSMTVAHGYIAAGGDRSQLFVARLSDGLTIFNNCVGGTVNNSLHINGPSPADLRMFVCNNDATIKVFELRGGASLTPLHGGGAGVLRCPLAINYAALSGDGAHLVAVGDSRDTYLYRLRGDGGYERVGTYSDGAAQEPCMSCAWNAAGTCFAVASQEGRCVVWDHRSGQAVAKFRTSESCRGVKFSCSPVDLLAFSEQRGCCHLVDSRAYGRKQALEVVAPPAGSENSISGISFTPTGTQLYVGLEEGLAVYDINVQARRAFPFCDTI